MMIAEDVSKIALCKPDDVLRPKKALLKRTVTLTRAALYTATGTNYIEF